MTPSQPLWGHFTKSTNKNVTRLLSQWQCTISQQEMVPDLRQPNDSAGQLSWVGSGRVMTSVDVFECRWAKRVLAQKCGGVFMMCLSVDELSKYLYYVRRLDFFETPDYDYLRQLFTTVLSYGGWDCDWEFDWIDRQLVSFISTCRTTHSVVRRLVSAAVICSSL